MSAQTIRLQYAIRIHKVFPNFPAITINETTLDGLRRIAEWVETRPVGKKRVSPRTKSK